MCVCAPKINKYPRSLSLANWHSGPNALPCGTCGTALSGLRVRRRGLIIPESLPRPSESRVKDRTGNREAAPLQMESHAVTLKKHEYFRGRWTLSIVYSNLQLSTSLLISMQAAQLEKVSWIFKSSFFFFFSTVTVQLPPQLKNWNNFCTQCE